MFYYYSTLSIEYFIIKGMSVFFHNFYCFMVFCLSLITQRYTGRGVRIFFCFIFLFFFPCGLVGLGH